MPIVTDMTVNDNPLPEVIGKAYLQSGGVTVGENIDGSSLNLTSTPHFVQFTLPETMAAEFRAVLAPQSLVRFGARYSTGEIVARTAVLVKEVNPAENGWVDYVLAVGPDEAMLYQPNPG